MTRLFDITTTQDALELDRQGQGKVVFTVTNVTRQPQRCGLRPRGLDAGKAAWLRLVGEAERDFVPGMVHQVEVGIAVPPGTPLEKFRLRLDAYSVANPDDDFTEGPLVQVLPPSVAPVAPGGGGRMPWWVWLAIALVVLAVGGLVAYLVNRKAPPVDSPVAPASAPASTPTPPPPPPPPPLVEFDNPRIDVGGRQVGLDVCREWGANCGQAAANAFCQQQGHSAAHSFKVTQDAPPTAIISTKQICDAPGCDRINWIQCGPRLTRPIHLSAETLMQLEGMRRRGKHISLPE
ncbi:hypothetical protein [Sphaerotilus sp.]|uniref:hypothetical protein n=1 Tax=Sphaerotilus sp. TaxID=2093942 RepID=UPI0025E572B9|nr:hypothetical protein [Sphaerotilus sp.]